MSIYKTISSMAVVFFSFAVIAYTQVTCPTGFNGPQTTTLQWTPSCQITIVYCWSISPGGVLTTKVQWIGGDINCITGFLADAGRDSLIMITIAYDLGTNVTLPNGLHPVPPCSTLTTVTFTLERAVCKFFENDTQNGIMWVKACSSTGICRRNYSVCVDFTTSPPSLTITYIDSQEDGTSNCSTNFPTIPENPENGWKSDCFMDPCS